ncbi:hypothetical protein INT45_013946 [Circinella minor]|uniref:Uncharacterized protein n=1 Tax=Circinella minor TaxID=1195481 RepID=A0A8H7S2Z6_9FUNG|nr:hypothetical protein INT45_013946 [Circinella minor]
MFLALTSDDHIPDHEHDHLLKHEDMDRRWHGCDWSTHESTNLLYYEPGMTTAELLYVKGNSDGFIRLTPENMDDDEDTEEEDNEEPLEEAGVSTHEPRLTILCKDDEPFVEEPISLMETTTVQKSLLENKSLVIEKSKQQEQQQTSLQQKVQEVQQQQQQEEEKKPLSPRPQPQSSSSSKKKKPNSGNKRKKRGTKFFW